MVYALTFQPTLLEKVRICQEETRSHEKEGQTEEEIRSQKNDKEFIRFSSRIWALYVAKLKKRIW